MMVMPLVMVMTICIEAPCTAASLGLHSKPDHRSRVIRFHI